MGTMRKSLSVGDRRLRTSVLFACAMEIAFLVFLTVFIFKHANPQGDGMEMVAVGFAVMFIFLPFTLPALILGRNGRWLVLAAGLAALAAVAYFALWLEVVDEMGAAQGLEHEHEHERTRSRPAGGKVVGSQLCAFTASCPKRPI